MRTGFCFDFDGTITDRELLPYLAESIDLADEISVLTRATIEGHLDFRKSFKLRCRLLGAIPVSRVNELVQDVKMQPDIVDFIRSRPEDCVVVTGNLDCWIGPYVAEHLGCKLVSSRGNVADDRLTGIDDVLDKGAAVSALREEFGWDRVVCIGDGMNDVPMLELADIAVAYGGIHTPCKAAEEAAHYIVYNPRSLCTLMSQF